MLKGLFYLCLGLLSLGQFSAIHKFGTSNLYLFDIAVAGFAFLGLVYFFSIRKIKITKSFLFLFFFTFVAICSLVFNSYKLSLADLQVSVFYLARWFVYLVAGLVVFNMAEKKLIDHNQILTAFFLSGLFVAFAGFIQLMVLPDFTVLDATLGWDPHKNRLASTFFDPNFTGAYLIICLCAGLARRNRITAGTHTGKIMAIGFGTLLLAIFLTFSRSSWLMLGVTLGVYGAYMNRKLLFFAFLIAALAYFAVPRVQTRISGITDNADSAHFRLISWSNAVSIFKNNWLLGVGFNTYRYVQQEYRFTEVGETGGNSGAGADSSFLLVLATTGVLGALFFSGGYFTSSLKQKNLLFNALFLGLFVSAAFINALFYPQILFAWLILKNCF